MTAANVSWSSSFSAAVPEVSGGTPPLPTGRLLLLAVRGHGDPAGDHQREAGSPVSHRHSENQETAVWTPPAMTAASDHSTLPIRRRTPLTRYRQSKHLVVVPNDVHTW